MLKDAYSRPMKDLRISVTDRCNFRCTYCMPYDHYDWVKKAEILSFEELTRLARIFIDLGVNKIRLTGGEPLVRQNLEVLVSRLSSLKGLQDLCLTTNGALLREKAPALRAAGLKRINVSLDSLQPEKFRQITKRGDLDKVLAGLFAAKEQGLDPIKINTVVERGVNDDEIIDLVVFCRENGFALRFIEYMDVGNANDWTHTKMVSKKEILEVINARFPLRPVGRDLESDTAVTYEFLEGGGDMGVIASVTEPFCSSCTRARLTADGRLVTCLFSQEGHNLKSLLRTGATDEQIGELIRGVWSRRTDRYSEERLEALNSSAGYDPARHRKIEMISLGG